MRETDKHTIQSKVRHLLDGLWRGTKKGKRVREIERERGRDGELAASLREETRRGRVGLCGCKHEGSGHGLSLKETEQSLQHPLSSF